MNAMKNCSFGRTSNYISPVRGMDHDTCLDKQTPCVVRYLLLQWALIGNKCFGWPSRPGRERAWRKKTEFHSGSHSAARIQNVITKHVKLCHGCHSFCLLYLFLQSEGILPGMEIGTMFTSLHIHNAFVTQPSVASKQLFSLRV